MSIAPQPALDAARPKLREHLPALDGLRGVAILLVLVHHFWPVLPSAWGPLTAIAHAGWLGVDLFFVLSGFLITGILYDTRGTPHYFRNFYARRTLRIFPLYYAALVGVFAVLPLLLWLARGRSGLLQSMGEPVRALQPHQGWLWTYTTNLAAVLKPEVNWAVLNHFWSLAVEEHFYLLWPVAIAFLNRRQAMGLCAACVLAALALRTALVLTHPASNAIYLLTPCRMDALAFGGLLALLSRGLHVRRLMPLGLWLTILGGGPLLALFLWRGELNNSTDPLLRSVGLTLAAVGFGGLLLLALKAPAGSPVGRVLHARALRSLGQYSYGLYVLHRFVMLPLSKGLPAEKLAAKLHSPTLAAVAYVLAGLTISLPLAWLSYHGFEKHFLRMKRHFE